VDVRFADLGCVCVGVCERLIDVVVENICVDDLLKMVYYF
jgi:hypothetical protein